MEAQPAPQQGTSFNPYEISSHKPPPLPLRFPTYPGEPTNPARPPQQTKKQKAFSRALKMNHDLSIQITKTGDYDLATRLKRCGTSKQLWICGSCGSTSYVDYACHTRICAVCSYKVSQERSKQVLKLFKTMDNPKWLTLTMSRQTDVLSGVDKIRKAFSKWRRLKLIKKLIKGGIYSIECKPKPDGWHVHIHTLIDSKYIPKNLIWSTWALSLNQKSASVNIQGNLNGSKLAHYITKYQSKPQDLHGEGIHKVLEFLELLQNRRLFGTFGSCHNQLEDKEKPAPRTCPHCGQSDAYLPFELGYILFGPDEWRLIADAVQGNDDLFITKIKPDPLPLFNDSTLPF